MNSGQLHCIDRCQRVVYGTSQTPAHIAMKGGQNISLYVDLVVTFLTVRWPIGSSASLLSQQRQGCRGSSTEISRGTFYGGCKVVVPKGLLIGRVWVGSPAPSTRNPVLYNCTLLGGSTLDDVTTILEHERCEPKTMPFDCPRLFRCTATG